MTIKDPKHKWINAMSQAAFNLSYWLNEKFELEEADPRSLKFRILEPVSCFLIDNMYLPLNGLYHTVNGVFWNWDTGRPVTVREYLSAYTIYPLRDFVLYTVLRRERVDEHLGCPSWPNCDEAPMGCIVEQGLDNVEWYGARD